MMGFWKTAPYSGAAILGKIMRKAVGNHINSLDGLRGIAALLVVVSHSTNATGLLNYRFGWGAGQFGVIVFFILSGFLMNYLYIDKPYEKFAIKKFVVSRVGRVLPLFYTIVLTSFFVNVGVFGALSKYIHVYNIVPANLLQHLLLLKGASVFWTIPAEIHFYIVFLLFWFISTRTRFGYYIFLLTIVFVLTAAKYPKFGDESALTGYLHFFIVGMLVAELYRKAPQITSKLDIRIANILFISVLFGLPIILPHSFKLFFGYGYDHWKSAIPILYCVLLMFLSLYAPYAQYILGNKVMQFFGNISYSLYLLHSPIQHTLSRYMDESHHAVMFLFLTLILSLIFAAISFYLFERPSQRFIKRVFYRS